MRVLMLGWEFPPYFAGGVGTVCYELTRALAKKGIGVTYIMPHGPESVRSDYVKLVVANRAMQRLGIRTLTIKSMIAPYMSSQEYQWNLSHLSITQRDKQHRKLYGENLMEEIKRFAAAVTRLADEEEYDIIHAHDWTTFAAAIAVKRKSGKPFIAHVHITEFDKTGGEHADPEVYRMEYEGYHNADMIIAVSNMVKQRLITSYHVNPEKIRVVYNSVGDGPQLGTARERLGEHERVVLFLGRVTLQKGPDYFLDAAAKVAPLLPNTKFIIAGTGDMLPRMIERAAELGLANKVIFPGFVTREEGDRLYRMADLFVMPSVSEPFGIVPLEAMRHGTPVIVSRQSGVSEILQHALKVDFWDTEDLASKIIAALTYDDLHSTLRHHGNIEISKFTWETPAEACIRIYHEAKQRPLIAPMEVMH
jgi:glycosyltransferase involved in cell wall biosynthesis